MYQKETTDNAHEKLVHSAGNYKASFDLTKFWGRDNFKEILRTMELSHTSDYFNNVACEIWHNDKVAIMTRSDPLTDVRDTIGGRKFEPAYASYIHIIGEKSEVIRAYNLIRNRSFNKGSWMNGWKV